jgi:WD40 repeat protein
MPLEAVSRCTLALDGRRNEVDHIAFSRDGSALFVGRYPTIFVVRVRDGATLDEIDIGNPDIDPPEEDDDYSERVRAITESADGTTLFVLCETMVSNNGDTFGWVQAHARDGGTRLWTVPSLDDEIPAPIDEETGVTQVVCPPDGDRVALVSLDGVLFVSSRTGKKRATIAWSEDVSPYDHIASAAFDHEGARLWLVWSPQLRCYDTATRKLARIVETTEDVALYDYEAAALINVRPSDGRLTVLTRDRGSLIVVGRDDKTVAVRSLESRAFTAHALIEHGDRWVRARADGTGPVAIESLTDVRVLEEPSDAPSAWSTLAVHEGEALLIARAREAKLWVHRVALD